MATLGTLMLGGRTIGVGVAFDLASPAPASHLYTSPGGHWQVELVSRSTKVAARTRVPLSRQEVLSGGLEQAQRCLDILSFAERQSLVIQDPGDNHIAVFVRDGGYVLQHVGVSPLAIGMNANVVVTDTDGNVLPQKVQPPVWTPALRYYRLSQANTDLYDAYRTLWLGFETLLDTVCPKHPAEKEVRWLTRALSEVGRRIDLKQFVPADCTDAVKFLVETQYRRIRCRLFHSKNAPELERPDVPDPEEVLSAYENLVRLWKEVAEQCASVRSGGGGAFTNAGFKWMLDEAFRRGLEMCFTDDPSPIQPDDKEVSPLGHPVWPFSSVKYLSETRPRPGRVALLGTMSVGVQNSWAPVHRICALAGEVLMNGAFIEEGLGLEDVDTFESQQTLRLVNLGSPRVAFTQGR